MVPRSYSNIGCHNHLDSLIATYETIATEFFQGPSGFCLQLYSVAYTSLIENNNALMNDQNVVQVLRLTTHFKSDVLSFLSQAPH